MSVKRLIVRNYRGVECLEYEFPPNGAVIKGRNGAGKTSILRAIESALLARDVAPDAIRKGADRAEILVDLDNHSVKRTITSKGNSLTVLRDGFKAPKPQTYLMELLGTSSLDPMDLLLLKGKSRKAKVLEALPVAVTIDQLRQWVPRIPDDFDCSGHGLEVIERVRAKVYEQRTRTNAEAKVVRQDADREAQIARDMAHGAEHDIEMLRASADAARQFLVTLKTRAEDQRQVSAKTADAREKVETLRKRSRALRFQGPFVSDDDIRSTESAYDDLVTHIEELKRQLAETKKKLDALRDSRRQYDAAIREANDCDVRAAELEAAISSSAIEAVSEEDIARAIVNESDAQKRLRDATQEVQLHEAHIRQVQKAALLESAAQTFEAEAVRLDTIVKALTNEAPATLLAQCDGIPGLSLRDDDILLDGVSLDGLCGAEQVRFCVEIARRANSKSKVLIVDGLERLDPESLDVFVREATRDGYQLLASRVDRGDVVIEAIEAMEGE